MASKSIYPRDAVGLQSFVFPENIEPNPSKVVPLLVESLLARCSAASSCGYTQIEVSTLSILIQDAYLRTSLSEVSVPMKRQALALIIADLKTRGISMESRRKNDNGSLPFGEGTVYNLSWDPELQ